MDWNVVLNGAAYGAIVGLAGGLVATAISFVLSPLLPQSARQTLRTALVVVLVVGGVTFVSPLLEKKFGPIFGPRASASSQLSGESHGA